MHQFLVAQHNLLTRRHILQSIRLRHDLVVAHDERVAGAQFIGKLHHPLELVVDADFDGNPKFTKGSPPWGPVTSFADSLPAANAKGVWSGR